MAIIWTDLIAATSVASADLTCIVDVSDSSQSPEGSSKQITHAALLARGTITASDPFSFTQTWNNGAVAFAGVRVAITNTASDAASVPFQVLGGGAGATNLLSVNAAGLVTIAAGITLSAGSFTGALIGNVTGNVTGNVSGTAGSVAASAVTGTTLAANVVTTSITAVGTIVTGVWTGTAIAATAGGTAQTTWTTGDLLYASGANTLAKRGIGSSGDVLTVTGGVPVWAALPAQSSTFTTLIQTTLTTEQLRLRYDASNYVSHTVDSSGNIVVNSVGAGVIANQFQIGGTVYLAYGQSVVAIGTSGPIQFQLGGGSTTRASLRIASGVAPTSPVSGDIWYDGTSLFYRNGAGVTKTIAVV